MGGGNLLTILISTIKSRFAKIMSSVRRWTSWNFIRSRVIVKIRGFFVSILDVRPKHEKDYINIGRFMISKRLAYMAIIVVGVVSLWYILAVRQVFTRSAAGDGIREYSYDAIGLRFAEGKVRILAKSGYLAYEGDVEKGYATGNGTLYTPSGAMVYKGNFLKNKFEEHGTHYWPDGTVRYTGSFHDNLYDGTGKQYRQDGSLVYEGEFVSGRRNGQGKLCDLGGMTVYEGSFANDEILYVNFLGATAEEAAALYQGSRHVWQDEEAFCVHMEDINVLYEGNQDAQALTDSVVIDNVIVLSDSFPLGDRKSRSIRDISTALGEPVFTGYSEVTMGEAVAIGLLNETDRAFSGNVRMVTEESFSDVTTVYGKDTSYEVYLTSIASNGVVYTFVSEGEGDEFRYYCISKGGADL
ncbi:MAG: hypothetical protein IK016_10770 [Lachnospiraceae bacterium]|nr:hypothetical protein [Lachnospiraceae bacterium]